MHFRTKFTNFTPKSEKLSTIPFCQWYQKKPSKYCLLKDWSKDAGDANQASSAAHYATEQVKIPSDPIDKIVDTYLINWKYTLCSRNQSMEAGEQEHLSEIIT